MSPPATVRPPEIGSIVAVPPVVTPSQAKSISLTRCSVSGLTSVTWPFALGVARTGAASAAEGSDKMTRLENSRHRTKRNMPSS